MEPRLTLLPDQMFLDFKLGKENAFQCVFNSYRLPIYNYAYAFTKSREEAEELVQEVFIALFLNRNKIETASGIYPYLFVLIKRMTISYFRKKMIESRYEDHLKCSWLEGSEDVEQSLDAAELSTNWRYAINKLPEKQKTVYELNKLEGMSYDEIAEVIGVSKNTVKNQLINASKTIKLNLKNLYIIYFFLKILF